MGGAQRELWVNSFSYGCIKDRLCLDFSLLSIFEDNIGHLDPETPPPFLASMLDRGWTGWQVVLQPAGPPVAPVAVLLNLCPAAMNEVLRYEVAGGFDEPAAS